MIKLQAALNNPWIFWPALLYPLPALLFSTRLPGWAAPLALVWLVIVVGLRVAAGRRLFGRPLLSGLVGAMLAWLGVSTFFSPDHAASLAVLFATIANMALFWAVASQLPPRVLRHSGWLIIALAAAVALHLLLESEFGRTKFPFIPPALYTLLPEGWLTRGYNPNMSGGLLALLLPPLLLLAWQGEPWQQRDTARVVALLLAGLLLLTQSRGALLGLLLGLMVVTILLHRAWLWFWLLALLLSGGAAITFGAGVTLREALGRPDGLNPTTLLQRVWLWRRAASLLLDHPLTGVGPGMLRAGQLIGSYPHYHAHNLYLQIGAEQGLPGLLLSLAFFGVLLYLLLRAGGCVPDARQSGITREKLGGYPPQPSAAFPNIRDASRASRDRQAGFRRLLALGLLGSMVVLLTHGIFDVITYYAWWIAPLLWMLFGLMIALTTPITADDAGLEPAG